LDFCSGMKLMCTSGADPSINIYMYACARSMKDAHLCNTDGDFLLVPQLSTLLIVTETGRIVVRPGEICVLPRGVVFQVHVVGHGEDGNSTGATDIARGYVLEITKGHFALPELGPIVSRLSPTCCVIPLIMRCFVSVPILSANSYVVS
jgi:homogentisate 1,2-dioxygenase